MDETKAEAIERVETGVPGLDAILKGGLLKGGVYLVMATPGSGKTILGNQICFNHAAAGKRALYVTLLAESHSRMLALIGQMSFFDEQRLANQITYLSGYQALESEKLDGLLKLLRKSIRDHEASILVVDGLVTAGSVAESDLAMRKFIHELQVFIEMVGCTTLLLTGTHSEESNYPERTMVDGLFVLSRRRIGIRSVRELEVAKLRGSDNLSGAHFFQISDAGITIHPRTEALLTAGEAPPPARTLAAGFGVTGLDEMLGEGQRSGSTTLLIGAPGSGKTTLGMQFLAAGFAQRERALYFGFFEPPDRLRERMKRLSIDVGAYEREDLLKVVWQPPLECLADALVTELLDAVTAGQIKRLFIDGLAGFANSLIYPGRLGSFLFALTNELRSRGVTTVISDETAQVLGAEVRLPEGGISEIVENIVILRYVEAQSQLRRIVSVVKTREGRHDTSLREFSIGERGVLVGGAGRAKPKAARASTGKAPPRRR